MCVSEEKTTLICTVTIISNNVVTAINLLIEKNVVY